MLIISRTPVRISLFGGGTDYRPYYERKKGAVLGTTIDHYTYISLKTVESAFFDYNIKIAYSRTELIKKIDEIQHPSIRECLKFHRIDKNLEIHIFSDLPAKSGLGSSSSFTVGFLNALYALKGQPICKKTLAEEACHIEQNLIQENVGSQDQYHAAHGGLNIFEFSSDGVNVKPIVIEAARLEFLQSHLMLFFTGLTRFASDIVKEQIENTKTLSKDETLESMYASVYEAENILYESPDVAQDLGKLLHRNWLFKKSLSSKISNTLIDEMYQKALDAGAFGGKLCGAGQGGFLALIAPPEKQPLVRQALAPAKEVSCRFDTTGSSIIYMKN